MDGIDAALVKFGNHAVESVASINHQYPQELRATLLSASRNPDSCNVDLLGELNTWTGECFRDACKQLLENTKVHADQVRAIGSHGQTIRHQPDAEHRFTLQIADPAIIATGTGIDTVADLRTADMALGGQGAPLAPALHDWLLRSKEEDRVVLNIGGIANVTLLPADGADATGFDTGPGNTLMDAWIQRTKDRPYDSDGRWAASGKVDQSLLKRWLGDEYFSRKAPKSTGFEHFNLERFADADADNMQAADVQATLAELTATSIAAAIRDTSVTAPSIFVCGGGTHNGFLLERIAANLHGASVATTAAVGLDPDYVEAVAFAWLAMRRVEGLPGNLPAVTGASRRTILGTLHKA